MLFFLLFIVNHNRHYHTYPVGINKIISSRDVETSLDVTTKWLLKTEKGNNRQIKYSENECKHRVMCGNCDKAIFF
jgi:hypothetical protein